MTSPVAPVAVKGAAHMPVVVDRLLYLAQVWRMKYPMMEIVSLGKLLYNLVIVILVYIPLHRYHTLQVV